jgi:hypothetical protein
MYKVMLHNNITSIDVTCESSRREHNASNSSKNTTQGDEARARANT